MSLVGPGRTSVLRRQTHQKEIPFYAVRHSVKPRRYGLELKYVTITARLSRIRRKNFNTTSITSEPPFPLISSS